MSVFERYLTLWVALCIVVGIALGHWFPAVFHAIGAAELAHVNLPVAALIWLMIIPMLVKVDFAAIGKVREHWRGIGVTLFINWAVKPFSMAALGWLFIGWLFRPLLPAAQIDSYIAGLINDILTRAGSHARIPSEATAAFIAVVITIYFWWRNTRGIHESSDDALKIMYVTTVMVVVLIIWCAWQAFRIGAGRFLRYGLVTAGVLVISQAVLGGLTSPFGAVVGGFLVGIFENLAGTYIPGVGNELKLPIALALIITVLVVKPAGLFGRPIVKRV